MEKVALPCGFLNNQSSKVRSGRLQMWKSNAAMLVGKGFQCLLCGVLGAAQWISISAVLTTELETVDLAFHFLPYNQVYRLPKHNSRTN